MMVYSAEKTVSQAKKITRELREGVNGSGKRIWVVFGIDAATGRVESMEKFSTEAEAMHWIKWA